MAALDEMLSNYTQFRQGGGGSPAPTAPSAPPSRSASDISLPSNGSFSGPSAPASFFSASGPGNVTSGAGSIGFGIPGGFRGGLVPDITKASPELKRALVDFSQNYIYSVPAGGYISAKDAQNANSAAIKYNMQSGVGNDLAKSIFGQLGDLPSIPAAVASNPFLRGGLGGFGGGGFGGLGGFGGFEGPPLNQISQDYFGSNYQGPFGITPDRSTYFGGGNRY